MHLCMGFVEDKTTQLEEEQMQLVVPFSFFSLFCFYLLFFIFFSFDCVLRFQLFNEMEGQEVVGSVFVFEDLAVTHRSTDTDSAKFSLKPKLIS